MEQKVANYTVIIEKQKRLGTNISCYSAYVPTLGIATEADTIEELQKEVSSLVKFHLESLALEGEKIPVEINKPFLTLVETTLPRGSATVNA